MNIFLPGTDKQFQQLSSKIHFEGKKILVLGSGCEEIAMTMSRQNPHSINIIVDDENSLIGYRFKLKNDNRVNITFMEFAITDFPDKNFDLIYAQGSVSRSDRKIITDEIYRILKIEGIYSVGEIVKLRKESPAFMKDIWNAGNLSPLFKGDIEDFYKQNKFDPIDFADLSFTLKDFYISAERRIQRAEKEELFGAEDKKLLKKFMHEVNAFNKLGGNKFMGFISLILRKTV